MHQLIEVLLFQAPFNTRVVMLGASLFGASAGLLGALMVLRRRALVSDVLSHATLPGIAIAFIVWVSFGFENAPTIVLLIGAGISGAIGLLTTHFMARYTRLSDDTALAVVLSCFFGFGIVLLGVVQNMENASAAGLDRYLFGHIASMTRSEASRLFLFALFVFVATLTLLKEFRVLSFDRDFARSIAWPVERLDLSLLFLITLICLLGMQSVGILLIVAMMIIPPAAATLFPGGFRRVLRNSALFGALSGYVGAAISSIYASAPTGAIIVCSGGAIFIIALFFAPRRGVLARVTRRMRLGARIRREHVLRNLLQPDTSIEMGFRERLTLSSLRRDGLVRKDQDALTEHGRVIAKLLEEKGELWAFFMRAYTSTSESHEITTSDLVEHAMSDDALRWLRDHYGQPVKEPS